MDSLDTDTIDNIKSFLQNPIDELKKYIENGDDFRPLFSRFKYDKKIVRSVLESAIVRNHQNLDYLLERSKILAYDVALIFEHSSIKTFRKILNRCSHFKKKILDEIYTKIMLREGDFCIPDVEKFIELFNNCGLDYRIAGMAIMKSQKHMIELLEKYPELIQVYSTLVYAKGIFDSV